MKRTSASVLACGLWLAMASHALGQAGEAPQPPDEVERIEMSGRFLVDVLSEYQGRGYRLLYSTGLVRPAIRLGDVPAHADPMEQLRLALESVGLTLRPGRAGVWRIVQAPRAAASEYIEGRVLDAQTGEPLVGVRVEIGGRSVRTRSDGSFAIPRAAPAPVLVSHAGYASRIIDEDADVARVLEIVMAPEPTVAEIVVVSSRYEVGATTAARQRVDMARMENVPRLGDDPLRIVSQLPGTASIGVSAKPHIRGGLQDELLVLFNNIELLEPFHLRDFKSVFSSFDPSLVQSMDVYTGGFPARYGDRMSGVMDIRPVDREPVIGGELSVSLLNTSALVHGPVADGRGDWVVSARRGNLDLVTDWVNSEAGDPAYNDAFAQFRFEIDSDTELDLGLFAYNDDVLLSDFDDDGEIATSKYENLYGWVQVHRNWSASLEGTSMLYFGTIDHRRRGRLADEDLDNGEATVDDRREFEVYALGQSLKFSPSDTLQTEFGFKYSHQQGAYDYAASIERGALAEIIGTELEETRAFRLRPDGSALGLFASVRAAPLAQLTVEAGVRWDRQDYTGRTDTQWSPRLSLLWTPTDRDEFRLSAGRFYQPEAIHELQVGDGVSSYQDAQHADHLIAGWGHRFSDSTSLRLEAFEKRFRDSKRRFENLFNPFVLLPELASDRVEIAPERGRARGIEGTLAFESDSTTAWLSVGYAEAEDRVNGRWEPRTWDQGATVSAGWAWRNERWSVGAALLWHDGWRTTTLPGAVPEDAVVALDRNAHRLKDYMTVDLRVVRHWRWERQALSVFVEVTNAFNRDNVGGTEYDVEEDEDNGGFLLTRSDEALLPLVPSIGIRWQF